MRRVVARLAQPGRRGDDGYAAVLAAIVTSALFLALAAIGVDLSRVYVEVDRVQKAADAAALAGVSYMPNNLPKATSVALAVAAQNGYPNGGDVSVKVTRGDKASQLVVTIGSTIDNAFGASFGVKKATVTRAATADYTPPAPMGSPCNTFGNEPDSTSGAAQPAGTAQPSSPFPSCSTRQPQFWAGIEGPETDKVQGDRYQAQDCIETGKAGTTYGCNPTPASCDTDFGVPPGTNCEYQPEGYFFTLHVEQGAVGSPIDIQLYDPAFVNAGSTSCSLLPSQTDLATVTNPYVTGDASLKARYGQTGTTTTADTNADAYKFCSGDNYPGGLGLTKCKNNPNPGDNPLGLDCTNWVTTSFALRHSTDTYDPMQGALINPSSCIKQFVGTGYWPTAASLTAGNAGYNAVLAKVFHQWYSLCTFTPDVAGDYYIQVRTNVTAGGTADPQNSTATSGSYGAVYGRPFPLVYTGNTLVGAATGNTNIGEGANAYTLRAVPTNASNRSLVSISGFERMPLLQTASNSIATFNLIRATPNAAGNFVAFDFFDPADATDGGSGTFKVLPPLESTSSFPAAGIANCRSGKNDDEPSTYSGLTNCQMTVTSSSYDGQVVHMIVPIPSGYSCNQSSLGGCWFRVQLDFGSAKVTDFTTWNATIGGDPVRLVK